MIPLDVDVRRETWQEHWASPTPPTRRVPPQRLPPRCPLLPLVPLEAVLDLRHDDMALHRYGQPRIVDVRPKHGLELLEQRGASGVC
jgi:hypothetical protein